MNFFKKINLPERVQWPLRVAVMYLPAGLFALYSLLMFFFYLGSVAKLPASLLTETSWISLGNVYELLSEPMLEELHGALGTLVAFAVIGLVCAISGLALLETPFYDLTKLNEKIVRILRFVWKFVPCLFYFLFFIVACVIYGKIAGLNSQMDGLASVAAGSCPALIMTFTILFALIHAASLLCEFFILKEKPQTSAEEIEIIEE